MTRDWRLGSMRLIAFVFVHGDQMLQEAKVHVVLMRGGERCKGGSEVTAVPAATAMARHFTAVLCREIK